MKTVDNLLQKYIVDGHSPSVQYAIFDSGHIIHNFRFGLADIANQKPVTGHTTMHAYSVTKTFTAIAVLQLAEKGLLQLTDPVVKYIPDFLYPPAITIKQLLTHTSGIPNPMPLNWIHLTEEHDSFKRDDFFNAVYLNHRKTNSKAGEKFAYSNLGFVLLGKLIENVTGLTYEQYITEEIISRLELKPNELGFILSNNEWSAKGYHKRFSFSNAVLTFLIDKSKYMGLAEGPWKPFKDFHVNGVSYGGLIGTHHAFVKYIQQLLKPDCNLIGDTLKKTMFTENITSKGKATGMCLSWFTGQLNGKTYYTHAGGGGGFYCEIRIYPAINTGSVIMFNRSAMTDERFLNKTDSFFIG